MGWEPNVGGAVSHWSEESLEMMGLSNNYGGEKLQVLEWRKIAICED